MTGNLTNAVLASMDLLSRRDSSMTADRDRLKRSAQLLFGFLFGCVIAAAAVALFSDWAWAFPVALSAVAVALRQHRERVESRSARVAANGICRNVHSR